MDIINVDDLASYLRDPAAADDGAANLVVGLTNALVTEAINDTTMTTAPARVIAVALEVAARAFRNPEGYSSETIDDYTYKRDSETQRAGVYLTSRERSDLEGGITPRAFVGWL